MRAAQGRDLAVEERQAPGSLGESAIDLLKARAAILARPMRRDLRREPATEALILGIGAERYAIAMRHVRQVARAGPCTPLPSGTAAMVGLMNLGGEVLAVFDLALVLGLAPHPPSEAGAHRSVVVVGDERDEFGLCVDVADEVATILHREILDPVGSGLDRRLLLGVTAEAIAVLDGQALIRDAQFTIDRCE